MTTAVARRTIHRRQAVDAAPTQIDMLARSWIQRKKTIQRLEAEIAVVGRRLIRTMKRGGHTKLIHGQDIVQLISDRKKRISKREIEKFFGEAKTNAFWKKLPERAYEYLTLMIGG